MQKIVNSLIPCLAWLYLYFVGKTSKVYWKNSQELKNYNEKFKNVLYALWHGRQLFLAYAHRRCPATILISQSKDGEYIAKAIRLFGMKTARGSSSRGGGRAMIELKRALQSQSSVAITPDGPRGPKKSVARGILFLAQKTGNPILPITYSAKRKMIFHGWDDYWVPLPFNSILINYGKPIVVAPEDDLEKKSLELAQELNRITDEADQLCQSGDKLPLLCPSCLMDLRKRDCLKDCKEGSGEVVRGFSLASKATLKGCTTNIPFVRGGTSYSHYVGISEKALYFFYGFGLFLFSPLILFAVFLRYPKTFILNFYQGLSMRFGTIPVKLKNSIWIHASSLGECRAAVPLIRAIRKKYSNLPIVFSSMTANGLSEARRLHLAEIAFYAPLDMRFILKKAFQNLQPQIILFLESEMWPNWLRTAKEFNVRVGIVNGRLSEKSAKRYSRVSWLSKILASKIDFVCAREKTDAERFELTGIPKDKIQITGNLKFDFLPWNLNGNGDDQPPIPLLCPSCLMDLRKRDCLKDCKEGSGEVETVFLSHLTSPYKREERLGGAFEKRAIWVAGSVRDGEEQFIFDAFLSLRPKHPALKLIFAPRHMENLSSIMRRLESLKLTYILKSKMVQQESDELDSRLRGNDKDSKDNRDFKNENWDVLVWDTFGDLWRAYQESTIVFVGGSLVPKGGQNPIEPAWFSKAVLFGPHMENFAEPAQALLSSEGALQVQDSSDLARKMDMLLSDSKKVQVQGENAKKTVESFYGHATQKTMEIVDSFIHG